MPSPASSSPSAPLSSPSKFAAFTRGARTASSYRRQRPSWSSPKTLRTEILAALVVGIALIPEAISFSVIAHVDPRVGLFASFTMAVAISTAEIIGLNRASEHMHYRLSGHLTSSH